MKPSLADLVLAYRQAKNAVYQEHRAVGRLTIAEREAQISDLLAELEIHLDGNPHWFNGLEVGDPWIVPKMAQVSEEPESADQRRVRIDRLEVQLHVQLSMEQAIAEVIWLWRYGAVFESLLSRSVFSNRLRLTNRRRKLDTLSPHLFEFWSAGHQRFRDAGMAVARRLVSEGVECHLVTLDFTSFYDSIDATFLVGDGFVQSLVEGAERQGIEFDRVEFRDSTSSLLEQFDKFYAACGEATGIPTTRGLPIGGVASRVIANLVLQPLDTLIMGDPNCAYYGRYVDDILLVSTAEINSQADTYERVSSILADTLPLKTESDHDAIEVDSDAIGREGCSLRLQSAKARVFTLAGESGLDFLDAIQRDLRIIGSERRAFLSPESLDVGSSRLSALSVGEGGKSPITVLREADRVKLQRYAASVAIGKHATAVELLGRPHAASWSEIHLGPLLRTATDSSHWVDFLDIVVRAFGICCRASDRQTMGFIVQQIDSRLRELPELDRWTWKGEPLTQVQAKSRLREWIDRRWYEEFCSAVPLEALEVRGAAESILESLSLSGARHLPSLQEHVLLLVEADLRTARREEDLAEVGQISRSRAHGDLAEALVRTDETATMAERIQEFLEYCREADDQVYESCTVLDILLMTRPPKMLDVSLRVPLHAVSRLADLTNAIRGTRYLSDLIQYNQESTAVDIRPKTRRERQPEPFVLVLGNLLTEESCIQAAAKGSPVLSPTRLARIGRLANQAIERRRTGQKPTVLLLPELSLPRRWLQALGNRLVSEDVGLVAGLEYRLEPTSRSVRNEAAGIFPVGRHSSVGHLWQKGIPASVEDDGLQDLGVKFSGGTSLRPPIHTVYGSISVLICSELLEVESRAALLGKIDMLLVPAWNKDLSTFEHMVQTTAMDLHAFVGLANNAKYSDCRVRVPASDHWRRDIARLIAPHQNECISVDVDIRSLRKFQLQSLGDLPGGVGDDPEFKPLPPGYSYQKPRETGGI